MWRENRSLTASILSHILEPARVRIARRGPKRALLGWETDLAKAAEVSENSVKTGATDARGSTLAKIQVAIEKAGIGVIPKEK
jgi:hypothetical protein